MELRPGWRQTEVGMIPEDWDIKRLGDLFQFRNGVNADKRAYGRGIRFVNVLEPITYSHLHGRDIPGRVSIPPTTVTTYVVKKGDVLFNRTSETDTELGLACTYLGSEHVVFGGFVIRGRPIDQTLDTIYSGYALRAPAIRSQIIPLGQGAVRANIGQDRLRQVFVAVPPLPEQRDIAAALSDMDALLEALARLIAKKRDLKHAAMQQLLTGQARLPGFSGEWTPVTAGEIGTFRAGNGFPIPYQRESAGQFPFYKVSDMNTDGNDTFMSAAKRWISESTRRALGARVFPAGSIVFAKVGAAVFLERKRILTKPSCIDNNLAAFVLDASRANVRFIHHALQQVRLGKLVSTTALPSLSGTALAQLALLLPSLPEQIAIAAVLAEMDSELAALKARRDKTHFLKQAVMQELLTGRTRLVDREPAHG